jgi:hypothetical protein
MQRGRSRRLFKTPPTGSPRRTPTSTFSHRRLAFAALIAGDQPQIPLDELEPSRFLGLDESEIVVQALGQYNQLYGIPSPQSRDLDHHCPGSPRR